MAAIKHAARFGQDADFLAAPTKGRLGVQNGKGLHCAPDRRYMKLRRVAVDIELGASLDKMEEAGLYLQGNKTRRCNRMRSTSDTFDCLIYG